MLNKKLLSLGMLAVVAVGMVGCGQKTEAPKEENDTQQEQQVQTETTLDIKATVAKIQEQVTEMPMTTELNADTLGIFYEGLTADDVEDFGGLVPMMQSTTEITFFKAKDGNTEAIKTAIEGRKAIQENNFQQYLPDQYEIIKEAQIIEKGDYVYFISAEPTNFEMIEQIIADGFAGK